jgi:hypothetical protein
MNLKKILPVFSYIFHPIFISFYGVLLYLWLSKTNLNSSITIILLIQVIILTVLLPLSIYYLMKATGHIISFTEASIKERKIPILLQAIFLFILIQFSEFVTELPSIYYFFFGGLIASLCALLFTIFNFKVSLHMIGVNILLAYTIGLGVYLNVSIISLIALLIVVVGGVASSRLYMKSHTVEELIAGTIIGLFSQIILRQFYL